MKKSAQSSIAQILKKRAQPLKPIDIPYNEAALLCQKSLKKILQKNSDKKTIEKKQLDARKIILQVRKFIENVKQSPTVEKNLIASFAPLHSYFLSIVFNFYPFIQNPFITSWKLFSQCFSIYVKRPVFDYSSEIEELKRILGDFYADAIEALEITFNKFDSFEIVQRALENMKLVVKNNPESATVFESLENKLRIIGVYEETRTFINDIDDDLEKYTILFPGYYSEDDRIFFLQSSLRFSLMFTRNNEKMDYKVSMNLQMCIRNFIHLSEFVEPFNLNNILDQYTDIINHSFTPINNDGSVNIIRNWLLSESNSLFKEASSFAKFYQAWKETNTSPASNMAMISNVYSYFLSFISTIEADKNLVVSDFIKNAIHRCSLMIIYSVLTTKVFEDALAIKDYIKNSVIPPDDVVASTSTLVAEIERVMEADVINEKYKDLMKRFSLIVKASNKLLGTLSQEYMERTAKNFFKLFPNILQFHDLFNIPNISGIKGEDVEEINIPTDVESITATLNRLAELCSINKANGINEEVYRRLTVIFRFVYRTSNFFERFIDISENKNTIVVQPTDTTKFFMELTEAILPDAISEETFGVVIVALYEEFSVYAEKSCINLSNALLIPAFEKPCNYILVIISAIRTLARLGEMDIDAYEVEKIYNKAVDFFRLSQESNCSDIQECISGISRFLPKTSLKKYLDKFVLTFKNFLRIQEDLNRYIPTEVNKMLVIAYNIQILADFAIQNEMKDCYTEIVDYYSKFPKKASDIYVKETLQNMINFVIKVKSTAVGSGAHSFLDSAIRYSIAFNSHKTQFTNDEEIFSLIEKLSKLLQSGILLLKDTEIEIESKMLAQRVLSMVFKLEKIIENKETTFATKLIMKDLTKLQNLILDFLLTFEIQKICNITVKAILSVPDNIRPNIPRILNLEDPEEFEPAKELDKHYSFKRSMNQLNKAVSKSNNSKVKEAYNKLVPLLDNPVISINPKDVGISISRFIKKESEFKERVLRQQNIVSEEINAVSSRMSLTSAPTIEFNILKNKIQKDNELMASYEKMIGGKNEEYEAENEKNKELKNRLKVLKESITPADLILSEIKDDSQSASEVKSKPLQVSNELTDIETYIKVVKKQNIKLKDAIKRARLAKEIPCIATDKKVGKEIIARINDLTKEIKIQDRKLHSFTRYDLQKKTGIETVEANDTVLSFIRMNEIFNAKSFAGDSDKGKQYNTKIDVKTFLSMLDIVEKYVYDLSQNRREYTKIMFEK